MGVCVEFFLFLSEALKICCQQNHCPRLSPISIKCNLMRATETQRDSFTCDFRMGTTYEQQYAAARSRNSLIKLPHSRSRLTTTTTTSDDDDDVCRRFSFTFVNVMKVVRYCCCCCRRHCVYRIECEINAIRFYCCAKLRSGSVATFTQAISFGCCRTIYTDTNSFALRMSVCVRVIRLHNSIWKFCKQIFDCPCM